MEEDVGDSYLATSPAGVPGFSASTSPPATGSTSRIALACTSCRNLKRRCDGGTPCDQCRRAGRTEAECVYIARPKKARTLPPSPGNVPQGVVLPYGNAPTFDTPVPAASTVYRSSTSTVHFIEVIEGAVQGSTAEPWMPSTQADPVPQMTANEIWALPPKERADHLIASFGATRWPVAPFMHWPSFLRDYSAMWATVESGLRPKPLFLALVNGFFSAAVQTSADSSLADEWEVYLARNRALLTIYYELDGSPDLVLVQALIYQLLTAWLHKSAAGMVGLDLLMSKAVGAAIALGLHRRALPGQFDETTEELRRRTWWMLYKLSLSLAMLTGLPLLIDVAQMTIEMPRAWPDDPSTAINAQYLGIEAQWAQIAQHIVEFFDWQDGGERSSADKLQRMLKLEDELELWKRSLPPDWSIDQPSALLSAPAQRLRLSHSYARLMIMRASLTHRSISVPLSPQLRQSSWQAAENACIESAHDLLQGAAHFVPMTSSARIFETYNTDFALAGLSVILAARLRGHSGQFERFFNQGLEIIRPRLASVAERLQQLAERLETKGRRDDDLLESLLATVWTEGSVLPLPSSHRSSPW